MKRVGGALGELDLIEEIRLKELQRAQARRGSASGVKLGIGDDCAILRVPRGCEMLVTTDFSLEGRHFRRDWHSPESAGHRCLARGLSDLAAMGAKPVAAFLSIALPGERGKLDRRWIDRFLSGLLAFADKAGVSLTGGDTAASPSEHLLADIVLVGSAPTGKALRRSTAKAGDLLYVTGQLGGAAAELLELSHASGKKLLSRMSLAGRREGWNVDEHPHLFPQPRLRVGSALRRRKLASACIDVSDGLSTDLKHLCDASEVAVEVEAGLLPVHPLVKRRLELALHGGEDYELLFAAGETVRMPRSIDGVSITRIGRFMRHGRGTLMTLIDRQGVRAPLEAGGWEHQLS